MNDKTSKKQALAAWTSYDMQPQLAESLVANNFLSPTLVQAQSLVFLNARVDMVIAAKTGQGKTLCFGIPITPSLCPPISSQGFIDLLLKRLVRRAESEEEEEFDTICALIMSPTRELALQIKDHIAAVIPSEFAQKIKLCGLVGGMSVQKQERLLSYKPTIIVATPGRLWELTNDRMNEYLRAQLPLIDVLVLDEADRMIEDGHFKEMKLLLDFVYTQRVAIKQKKQIVKKELTPEESALLKQKEVLLRDSMGQKDSQFVVGKNLVQKKGLEIDFSQVQDLFDEDEMMQEIDPESLQVDDNFGKQEGKKDKKGKTMKKEAITAEEEEQFYRDYKKVGGIQHIICSATMTIDQSGRVTPKLAKKLKKTGFKQEKETANTVELLCKALKFRSKQPKVIDLTEEERMPETLKEEAVRCKKEEKDLFTYYYLKQNAGESTIIFCNSITCTMRVSSLLSFLKIKNHCLHSKLQQRQRLKNLDRFKSQVQQCEAGSSVDGAVLVCTDVAARGLDIPYVQNVLHYQCPFNAEIYIHRCGRTARIGREGECLALLAPEDEKNFKLIAKVLKKSSDAIKMYEVNFTDLKRLEPLIEAAKKFEAASHREVRQQKSDNWIFKTAMDADLVLDEDIKQQIHHQLEDVSMKKKNKKEVKAPIDIMDEEQVAGARHKAKEMSKVQQMKAKYDHLKSKEGLKKFGNSSFLTPEAASYLNEMMKAGTSQKVDSEIVYAGMHSQFAPDVKFKRNLKYTKRYKNRSKKRNHKTRFQ